MNNQEKKNKSHPLFPVMPPILPSLSPWSHIEPPITSRLTNLKIGMPGIRHHTDGCQTSWIEFEFRLILFLLLPLTAFPRINFPFDFPRHNGVHSRRLTVARPLARFRLDRMNHCSGWYRTHWVRVPRFHTRNFLRGSPRRRQNVTDR